MAITIRNNCALREHNTLGLDVKASQFITYDTIDELVQVLEQLRHDGRRVLHIGHGSNLLFTKDFEGTILHSRIRFVEYLSPGGNEIIVRVGAGVTWDDFCAEMARNNYYGSENLSHIPGEVGAAAVQNIGAYGVEVEYRSDDVRSLRLFYQWEPEYSLDKVVEMLNNFEAISIRHEGNQLIVESKDLK